MEDLPTNPQEKLRLSFDEFENLSYEEAHRELDSRLNGGNRGDVEVNGENFSTEGTSNDSLLYVIKSKNPEEAKIFRERTREKREVLRKKVSQYLIGLWANVFQEYEGGFDTPTKKEILEKISGVRNCLTDLETESGEVLSKNLYKLLHNLYTHVDNIYDKVYFNGQPDDEEVSRERYHQYIAFVESLHAAVLALKISEPEL